MEFRFSIFLSIRFSICCGVPVLHYLTRFLCNLRYKRNARSQATRSPILSMKHRSKSKLPKFYRLSRYEKEHIIDEFWRDYFTKYPEFGNMDELNIMRRQFKSRGQIRLPSEEVVD